MDDHVGSGDSRAPRYSYANRWINRERSLLRAYETKRRRALEERMIKNSIARSRARGAAKGVETARHKAMLASLEKARAAKAAKGGSSDLDISVYRHKVKLLGYYVRDYRVGHYHHPKYHLDVFVNLEATRRERLAMLIKMLDEAKED